jgi:hypothetical protein
VREAVRQVVLDVVGDRLVVRRRDDADGQAEVLDPVHEVVMDPAREVLGHGADDDLVDAARIHLAVDGVECVVAAVEDGDVGARGLREHPGGGVAGPVAAAVTRALRRDHERELRAILRRLAHLVEQPRRGGGLVGHHEDPGGCSGCGHGGLLAPAV